LIDTIRFKTSLTLKATSDLKAAGWQSKTNYFRKEEGRKKGQEKKFEKWQHPVTGTRLIRNPFSDPDAPWEVETSLPIVLHGSNSLLIRNQHQLNRAIDALISLIKTATRSFSGVLALNRVDLCWQIPANLRDIIPTHAGLTPIDLDGKHIIWWNETILWEAKGKSGKAKKIRMQIYDKRKEKTRRMQGSVARLEIQFRGEKDLKHQPFILENAYRPINFNAAYSVLRQRFIALAQCKRSPTDKRSIEKELLKWGISWANMLPSKIPQKFKKSHGCEYADVPRYTTLT